MPWRFFVTEYDPYRQFIVYTHGVLALLRGRTGHMVLTQFRDAGGERAWMRATGPTPVPEPTAEEYVARQVKYDPDLWVLEFDAPDYLQPFEGKLV